MHSSKTIRYKRTHSKKENKLSKLIKNDPDVEGEESEHELSFYLNDRVKLMKEVLKIIKPKKIRTMAPNCMKNLDNEEINSMLLEELLGISNKRLKYIFNGQNLNEEGSSTDPEEEEPIDIISLDDISDDDFIIDLDSDKESKKKHHRKHKSKIKEEPNRKKVKKEKPDKHKTAESSQDFSSNQMTEQNLMSVLELLELQARARAIRSQLVLENSKKAEKLIAEVESSDNEDDVIVESPQNVEIVITSSDSENEMYHEKNQQELNHHNSEANIEDRLEKKEKKMMKYPHHRETLSKP
ncbi:hypothetical protein JTB14_002799 [Gonioctena quinquepunctata]|nr:hypothetical protein JTB14_002799 [Gonioctena quinquepunctata]